MRLDTRRSLVAVAAAATIVAAPTAVGVAGGTATADSDRTGHSKTQDDLQSIGLVRAGTALVRFRTDNPSDTAFIGAVSGLVQDEFLVGIDYRVQNGRLYGVGNEGGIYTLRTRDASADVVSRLTVPLQGSRFGVDFNPDANALRVISDTGQNLRHSFAVTPPGPTTVDGTLTYPPLTTPATGLTAAAYTNNDLDPDTGATLYDVDTNLNQVAIQAPANEGNLSRTGALGVDPGFDAGFDIYSTVRNGKAVDLDAYATLRVNGKFRLYEITLFNGDADLEGTFSVPVTDIAIPLDQL